MRARIKRRAACAVAWGLLLSVVTFPLVASGEPTCTRTVYSNDFASGSSAGFSPARGAESPSGQRFLGEYGRETVTLAIAELPDHSKVTLTALLYVIRSWDGNSGRSNGAGGFIGPDLFDVAVEGGPSLLHTTFSNIDGSVGPDYLPQAYPGAHPLENYPARHGGVANRLGYDWWGDTVYRLEFSFHHSGQGVAIDFRGGTTQSITDESWGLDDVTVILTVPCPPPAPPPPPQCQDGRDNDSDGATDYPDDPDCEAPGDGNEYPDSGHMCGVECLLDPIGQKAQPILDLIRDLRRGPHL